MEQSAKGRRSVGNSRSEVQESRPRDAPRGPGRQRKPGELRAAAPRHPERTLHHRPHRPSTGPGLGSDREQPGEGPDRTRGDKKKETRRRRPLPAGPVGRGTEGGVVGVGSQGRRRQLGAYLSPGSASSTACRTEELVVLLQEDCPTRVRTIPPRAPSHRDRSNRNHRSGEAGSSPPLGD